MSHAHHDNENAQAANPIKMTIAVTVGAFGLIVAIILLAQFAVGSHVIGSAADTANTPEAIAKRIAPAVELAQGDASKVPPVPPVASLPAAAIAPALLGGEATYKSACFACHDTGVAGAPKIGDKAAWTPRAAQGKEVLYGHALAGFVGKAGAMPAKGGNVDLMLARSK
jgi:cytochrome c5